jgi:polysaccharide pyruvyl transferase WcaK-like protein
MKLPHVESPVSQPRILLFGYHGLRNAGAESRLVSIVHALQQHGRTNIDVATFDRRRPDYLLGVRCRYVNPAMYKRDTYQLIHEADIVVLTEGNMLSDAFTSQMVRVHTTVMEQAFSLGVPVVGLALDSGSLSTHRIPRVTAAINTLRLLTLRTPNAADDLRRRGVTIPMTVTADCAVSMPLPSTEERAAVAERFGLTAPRIHCLAPVDFFMYPAKIRLIGRPREYVRYPFKGTWPHHGRRRSQVLARQWIQLARRQLERDRESMVMVVAMDPSDNLIAQRVYQGVADRRRCRLVSCRDLNTLEMSAALSLLSSIVTSRYHALVMPLVYTVPFIALGHDNRTRYITEEIGLEKYFVPSDTPKLGEVLINRHAELMQEREQVRSRLRDALRIFQTQDLQNYKLLDTVIADLPTQRGEPYQGGKHYDKTICS